MMDGADPRRAPLPPIQAGGLEARLAATEADIDAAQALRYRVFYEERRAKPSPETAARRRDTDGFDAVCDHLLVIDRERPDLEGGVVGTYRAAAAAAPWPRETA